jgi:nucleotide-binding universal stress UspA family protein
VAVDYSAPARRSFEQALALARRHGAALTVVHAVPADEPFGWGARARLTLIDDLRAQADAAGVRLAVTVQQGDPAGVILLHARSLRPDLLVVGTGQRRGLARMRVGSTAERVALNAARPVLIVPARRTADPSQSFERIVVAVDASAASAHAVDRALRLAAGGADRVTLVHVVPGFADVPPQLHRFGVGEFQRELIRDASERLSAIVASHAGTGQSVDTKVVAGEPVAEIARQASLLAADLLVAGVRTRGRVARAVFGATAARLLRITQVPLLAVPDTLDRTVVETADAPARLAA